jgi:oligopeptide/dipeptide ABC transporter ATP-binding protein
MSRTLLAKGLRVGVTGGADVVEGLDLALRAGEMLALVGESGCGKSAAAAALGGILPPGLEPRGGTVAWDDGAPVRRGEGIAYVFQEPATAFNPVLTVGFQIAEAMRGKTKREARERGLALLRDVELGEAAERVWKSYPMELSGGQLQRAFIAMALAGEPAVLVADEPTTALDVTVQRAVLRLLRRACTAGTAVLLITHNLGVVALAADRVCVMYAGRAVESGPVAELLRAPRHPYVKALLAAVPRLAVDAGTLQGIPGRVPPPEARGKGCAFAPRCPQAGAECRESIPPMVADGDRAVACHDAAAPAAAK